MYDESGQVFTEFTCSGTTMTPDWVWRTTGSTGELQRFRSPGSACSSLTDMCTRSFLANSCNITLETLAGLPWEIGHGLWQKLVASKLDSVKAWKAFAATYRAELDANLKRKYHIVARPTMTLAMYIAPITSPSLDWISYLTLSNVTCTRIDLIQLVQLANLGVLTIGANVKAPDVGLDDNIVRTWARSAATSNAFGILRVLNCRSQTHLTGRVFDYLEEFPALSVFSLEASSIGPDIRGVSQKVGWRCSTGEALAEWLIKRGASIRDWDSVIHACFRAAGVSRKFGFAEEKVQVLDSLPVLHLSLGGMPPPALVDVASDDSLILFHRVLSHAAKSSRIQDPNPRSPPRKKRMIRASKRQCMEHLLLGLET